MMKSEEIDNKKSGKRALGKEVKLVQKFYFPNHRKEVEAGSYEEALAIINKEESIK